MKAVNTYLNFQGNTEDAFNFYKSVFGGDFSMLARFKGTPGCENIPADEADKIMHIALPLANGTILMGTDALQSMGQQLIIGDNVSISIHAESREETDNLYTGLASGGKATMPPADMPWGDYWGLLTDKFGIQWMVSYTANPPQ